MPLKTKKPFFYKAIKKIFLLLQVKKTYALIFIIGKEKQGYQKGYYIMRERDSRLKN